MRRARSFLLSMAVTAVVVASVACTTPGLPPDYTGAEGGERVAILGDDAISSAQGALRASLDGSHRTSTVAQTGATAPALSSLASYYARTGPDHAVVHVGSWDLAGGAQPDAVLRSIEQLVEPFAETTCVHVSTVGLYVGGTQYFGRAVQLGNALQALAVRRPNVRIIPWGQVELIDRSVGSPNGPLMQGHALSTVGASQFAEATKASIDACRHPAEITTFVFEDANRDGVRQPGEAGADGVVVRLVPDPTAPPANETPNDHRVTAGGGLVRNTGLVGGDYVVLAEDQSLATTTTPVRFVTAASGTTSVVQIGYHDSGPRIAVLGDSITHLAKPALRAELDAEHRLSIWAQPMQPLSTAQPTADAYAANPPEQVVINLGTNDLSGSVDAAIAALGRLVQTFSTVRCVHVTTLSEMHASTAPAAVAFNGAVRGLPQHFPNVDVIDWSDRLHRHAADPGAAGPLLTDGIHPTALGQRELARLSADAVHRCD